MLPVVCISIGKKASSIQGEQLKDSEASGSLFAFAVDLSNFGLFEEYFRLSKSASKS